MATFAITQQIEEVERELALRAKVYPNMVRRHQMRQSVADYHMARLRAVLDTLEWLSQNRTRVIAKLEEEAREQRKSAIA